ncbi:hypothetical protein Cgig2_004276 [Carnegiea gigantea]|uniref:Uncharacterized protein n=1 Tax=Carnegiea gigantea TaxID=171969 RepID=A0A9Q1QIS9_9CARY|nr:hypothetical protein Cgig2_004276 [Carnegiea gigantea]
MVFSGSVSSRLRRSVMMRGFARKKIVKRPSSTERDSHVPPLRATAPPYVYDLCPDMNPVAPNSKYHMNVNTVLSFLSSNTTNDNRLGSKPTKFLGVFPLCRRGVHQLTKCKSSNWHVLEILREGKAPYWNVLMLALATEADEIEVVDPLKYKFS